jgi:hypothetical protein
MSACQGWLKRSRTLVAMVTLTVGFASAALASGAILPGFGGSGYCGITNPSSHGTTHGVTYSCDGYLYCNTASGTHTGPPWYDTSCGMAYGGGQIDVAALTMQAGSTSCSAPAASCSVMALLVGGGCGQVAGPNGALLIPEVTLAPEFGGWPETVQYPVSFSVDHLSNPQYVGHFDVNHSLGSGWSSSASL